MRIEQVGPGDLPAIFLLDRPQEPARLVEIHVVRPAVEGRETLLAGPGAAAAVGDAVGAGAVPGHADEERSIVAEIGGPPCLRVRHHGTQVLDHRIKVEALELLGVVERLAHRIGQTGVRMENPEIELVRPPVAVRASMKRALTGALIVNFCVHDFSPIVFCNSGAKPRAWCSVTAAPAGPLAWFVWNEWRIAAARAARCPSRTVAERCHKIQSY